MNKSRNETQWNDGKTRTLRHYGEYASIPAAVRWANRRPTTTGMERSAMTEHNEQKPE